MTDIHSHLLYDIDDGANTRAETEILLRTAADNRITDIIATPHLYSYNRVHEIAALRDERIAALNGGKDFNVKIHPGFEVFCGEGFERIADYTPFTLNASRYMLVEFEFYGESLINVLRYCDRLVSEGIVPIIAHPERYGFFLEDYDAVNSFAGRSVLFQLNVGSLTGAFGTEEKRLAFAMLDAGYCDFLATDAHSPHGRSSNLLEMICAVPELDISQKELERITKLNPFCVIENSPVNVPRRGKVIG